ncbi:MAG: hypothetical protein GEU75_09515 [Dehalococcoidia bacterium]|nr:hypothetical protein [Dehalococcoidia bacterium]
MSENESPFRLEAREVYDEYAALLLLGHWITPSVYEEIQRARLFIQSYPSREVRPFINNVRKKVRELRSVLHIICDGKELREILSEVESQKKTVGYLSKGYLDTIMRLERVQPAAKDLPIHTRMGFTLQRPPDKTHPELFLLEAKLYEDMCSLFNMCFCGFLHEDTGGVFNGFAPLVPIKARDALIRASFVAAFEFIEAYLNGIALDYLYLHQDADEKTVSLLTEQPRHISFRDKALQYPKIVKGSQHPLLTEGNCPELALLIEHANTRGALVHPAAWMIDSIRTKQDAFFTTKLAELCEIVDAAVGFVLKVEAKIERRSVIVDWILPRAADGLFPAESFQ